MTQRNNLENKVNNAITYGYIVECADKRVHLLVESRDVFYNADDEIDCPLDVVLRKNNYTLQDLMNWDAREIRFIQTIDGKETILNSFSLDVNL